MRMSIKTFVDVHHTDCKIIGFKVHKQVFFNPCKSLISSLFNFQKICLYFFDCRTLFYVDKLS